ncbi:hypothetical protein GOODEAATRI_027029, partial [Goodea atripinnis]
MSIHPHCQQVHQSFPGQEAQQDYSPLGEDVRVTIEKSFYVENCLQSFPTPMLCLSDPSVPEIQELMDPRVWRDVNLAHNPGDYGKTLLELSNNGRWKHSLDILQQAPDL